MKRSSNVGLVAMGALAFTASFAGASAYLAWQKPTPAQNCTTTTDGRQTCATPRSGSGYWHGFHYWSSPDRAAAATPSGAANASARLVSGASGMSAGSAEAIARGGFGASGRTAFRGSAAG
jgi:hypothetical protein